MADDRAAAVAASPATPSRTVAPAARPPRAAGAAAGGRRGPASAARWRKRAEIAFFVAPALALFVLFVVWPIITAVQMSLYKWRGFGPMVDFVGLGNYISVLTNQVFTDALVHNLVIMVGSILLQLPLGLAIALLLNRRMWGQGILRTIIFVPYVLAEVIAGVVWFQLLQPQYGVIDTVLAALGLSGPPQGFLGTPDLALWTVLIVLTWKYLGLAVILFLAGLQGVPEDLYEAAQLDGASWWQVQRKITIPLLGPTMRTWAFLSMIGSLQLFDMVWILTKGGPANSTTTMATFLIDQGTRSQNFGIAGAASVVLFVVALVLAVAYQRFILSRDTRPDDERRGTRKGARS
ncbi:carbohydrate ABC transporter permease [Microbacterium marinilacus]|uniref:Sugar ABC transporter permease n=1 Tax=Microbacterium marinilacus TaxID=415209 RepID=A0ABP7BA44_9MICO|nr:sugar ABC transporter permease [Microbacterium marinilacus]MBY0687274.1 sugar ABC transporter permease [Microbacterium marinilacus]